MLLIKHAISTKERERNWIPYKSEERRREWIRAKSIFFRPYSIVRNKTVRIDGLAFSMKYLEKRPKKMKIRKYPETAKKDTINSAAIESKAYDFSRIVLKKQKRKIEQE